MVAGTAESIEASGIKRTWGVRSPCRKKSEPTTYADCREPYHLAAAVPLTAEAFMRSHYSAFAVQNAA